MSTPRPVYITTPIYYVNDKPHIGHAYTTIVADYLARANRLLGHQAYFLTGTDEHGARIAEVAREHGKTPQEWCDEHSAKFKAAWERLSIQYDGYIRTTDKRHEAGVQRLLDKMHKAKTPDGKPVVYEDEYVGLYCKGCEKFITEKELVDGHCPLHPYPPEKLTERNYFFRLSAYLPQVEEMIRDGRITILPDERRREVLGLFKQGLENFSISREKVDWGVPLPFDPSQNAYVWVDALPNYITAIGFGDDPKQFKQWWNDAHIVHLLGKDILKFHAIFWPAMLLSIGEKVPDTLFIHGYFTVNGQKMSKSLGNVIDPNDMVDQFGPDGARYLLLTQFQFGQDGDVKADQFIRQYNTDLANDLGNLVSRVISLINQNFGDSLPVEDIAPDHDEEFDHRETACINLGKAMQSDDDAEVELGKRSKRGVDPNAGIDAAMSLVRDTNLYVEQNKPWKLAKEGKKERLRLVLSAAVENIRVAAILLSPAIPAKSLEILRALGVPDPEKELTIDGLTRPEQLRPRCTGKFSLKTAIFPRFEFEMPKPAPAAKEAKKATEGSENVITINQFFQSQLRTAVIREAERVEGATKLLKLQIELGEEKRQIVAGIAEHYQPEELVGRTIVVVANLQPATIRGVESNGMLLAASSGKTLRLVSPDGEIKSGAKVG